MAMISNDIEFQHGMVCVDGVPGANRMARSEFSLRRNVLLMLKWIATSACSVLLVGCDSGAITHPRFRWDASTFFKDPKGVELCQAINDQDIGKMQVLLDDGVSLNQVGKRGMTPLLWGMGQESSKAFVWLLDHGVKPDQEIIDDLDEPKTFQPNASPLCICIVHPDESYAIALLKHGADPNFMRGSPYSPPLHAIIRRGIKHKWQRIQLLLDNGADINAFDYLGDTPPMNAIRSGDQYDIALRLLDAGADAKLKHQNTDQRLVHFLVSAESRQDPLAPEKEELRQELLKRLEDLGESLEVARKDLDEWKHRPGLPFH